jgi:hypothetical protein
MRLALRLSAGVLVLCALSRPVNADSTTDPSGLLSSGRLAYERGDYEQAVKILRPLLYPSIELSTEESVLEAHRLLALSYLLLNKEPEAEQEATALFSLQPSFQLDPVVDPPMAVHFFESIRQRQQERLLELERRQKEEVERSRKEEERRQKEAHARAERVYIERTVERHSRLLGLVPFGVGQVQNGQRGKAIFFAVSELLTGLVSVSAYLAIDQRYPAAAVAGDPSAPRDSRTRFFPASDKSTAQALVGLQLGSGIAFWGLLAWGIIDAEVLFKKEVEVKKRELPPAGVRLTVSPLLSPSTTGYGLQLGGTF